MDKQKLYTIIEEKSPILTALSDKIWEYAELSMMEVKSTAAYVQLLKDQGFTVEENLCGIPTAFSGTYGSGKPVIGILGEYDALSGLSQVAGASVREQLVEGGCGHGCGHNLLGAGALGAAIAIKEAIAAGALSGTVIFYGCPGEEGCAGKTFMARDGMFRDLDAAITWHPGDTNEIMVGSNAACIQVEYTFTGIAAHAAGDPFNGRSALDAAELMNVGVNFLREHMRPKESVHYSFADAGGISPNVVQPTAKLIYMVRGETVRTTKALLKRVDNIAKGAALMTDCSVTSRQIDGTSDTLSNQVLEQLLQHPVKPGAGAAAPRQSLRRSPAGVHRGRNYPGQAAEGHLRSLRSAGPAGRRESHGTQIRCGAFRQRPRAHEQFRHSLRSLQCLLPRLHRRGRRQLADPHRPVHRRYLALRFSRPQLAECFHRQNQHRP